MEERREKEREVPKFRWASPSTLKNIKDVLFTFNTVTNNYLP